jgi:hypothetical protein
MMKRVLSGLVVAFVLGSLSAGALAQPKPRPVKKSDDCAEQRKKDPKAACTLEIDGDEIGGERVAPGGDVLLARREATKTSLIRIRTNMVDKVLGSAERF